MSILSMRRRSVVEKKSKYLMTAASNPEVFAVCLAQGWCSSEGMSYEDAALITSLGSNGRVFQGNTDITHFEELAYFGITEIQNYSFDGCTNLTNIGISDAVTRFGSYCFRNCALVSVYIPANVTSIGDGAFQSVSSITNVVIPANITSIGSNAFSRCSGLTYIKCLAVTPPTLGNSTALGQANYTYLIYVPDSSINTYQSANIWSNLSERIKPLSEFVQP